jgi:O-antigen/teichoic acid export membrane protein
MIKRKFLSDISITTAQAILNQFSGIVVFFIISWYLDKNSFGQISWALAMLMLVFSVLGFGLEQLTVKKVAMGTDPALLLPSYLFHVIVMGSGFVIVAFLIGTRLPIVHMDGRIFTFLALSQCFSFFATPFRQIANGLEKFSSFFIMSCTANILKVVFLLVLAYMQKTSLEMILYAYLLSSFAELVVCAFVFRARFQIPIIPRYDGGIYFNFIKEALPQFGITVCNTALQRMDWILLGVLSTSVALAEYSFTNKLFELLLLPLLMIAPVLFPMVVKAVNSTQQYTIGRLKKIIKIEVMVAVLIALIVNACWKDVIDLVTAEKYGSSTSTLILIMSFAMPLAYINNFFWSIHFAKGNMRIIFVCILTTFLVNTV